MSARVYRGTWTMTSPVLTIDDDGCVYEGTPIIGAPIMKIAGERVYKGTVTWGSPLATVKGNYVYKGTGFIAAPLARIDGDHVYQGTERFSAPLATVRGGGRMSAAVAAVYLLLW